MKTSSATLLLSAACLVAQTVAGPLPAKTEEEGLESKGKGPLNEQAESTTSGKTHALANGQKVSVEELMDRQKQVKAKSMRQTEASLDSKKQVPYEVTQRHLERLTGYGPTERFLRGTTRKYIGSTPSAGADHILPNGEVVSHEQMKSGVKMAHDGMQEQKKQILDSSLPYDVKQRHTNNVENYGPGARFLNGKEHLLEHSTSGPKPEPMKLHSRM